MSASSSTTDVSATTIVKVHDAECEWWVERTIRRAYAPKVVKGDARPGR